MDFDSMAIFYLIPILEIVEKTPSRGPPPNNLARLKMGTTFCQLTCQCFIKVDPTQRLQHYGSIYLLFLF